MTMDKQDRSLDELMSAAVRHEIGTFDFDRWKQQHPQEVREFQAQAVRADRHPPVRGGPWGPIRARRLVPLAIAALVLLAVLAGIRHFGGAIDGAGRAYGITDLPGLLQRAQVIHLVGWRKPSGPPVGEKEQLDKYPTECWMDMQHEQYRNTWFQFHRRWDGRPGCFHRMETIVNGPTYVQVDHDAAEAGVYRLSDFQRKLLTREKWEKMLEWVYRSEDGLAGFVRTGGEVIDGTVFDVWEEQKKVMRFRDDIDQEEKTQVWLSPSSGAIGRYRHWTKDHEHLTADKVVVGPWQLDTETRIETGVNPPEDAFRFVPPEGYRTVPALQDAVPYERSELFGALMVNAVIGGRMHLVVALPGGVVIMGWSIEDVDKHPYRRLAGLEPGRSLPLLPVDILYGLAPRSAHYGRELVFEDTSIVYQGRHLASTRKDGRLYEWAIYVPSRPIDAARRLRRCDVIVGLDQWNGRYGNLYDCTDLFLEGREFVDIVLGAMADLSDSGVAPEHVTYQAVLELAGKIRASIDRKAFDASFGD